MLLTYTIKLFITLTIYTIYLFVGGFLFVIGNETIKFIIIIALLILGFIVAYYMTKKEEL